MIEHHTSQEIDFQDSYNNQLKACDRKWGNIMDNLMKDYREQLINLD